ncbi:MAG TPA: hypothetical protein VMP86_03940 [Candidatus Binatia bacterium]|nr:hypothetical protein [Candidatus Binatia bacterium]
MFGRGKREKAAAEEAAREAERRAVFARLAERPEHVCPFLGLADERTGYVEGVSDEHRCYAFGDPAPLSAEQQTRVCQQRGYGNCPRYLRGVLVIPTEELEALRQRRAPRPDVVAPPPVERRRRAWPLLLVAALILLVAGAGAGAYLLTDGFGTALAPSPSPSATTEPSAVPSATPSAEPSPSASPASSPDQATPTPEATPEIGDQFAFYEVSVGPGGFTLYEVDAGGDVTDTLSTSFAGFSFARVEPVRGGDGETYWETVDGDLAGWSYRYPDSGDFRIRAVFFNTAGERRSEFLPESELTTFPEATPAP